MLAKSKPLPKSCIPNTEGFCFNALLKDGSVKEDIVKKNENGMYYCDTFKEMQGWFRINYFDIYK
jgi:hypothetical protein